MPSLSHALRMFFSAMLTVAAWTSVASAQAPYPTKPIVMVVPYPAGGVTDLLARMVAEHLKTSLKATVVIENKPGAATTIAAGQVAKAEPDGHTLMIATSTTLAVNPALYKKLAYDAVRDFTPIAAIAGITFALVVNPDLPVKTLADFIAYAKARPGELSYGSPGSGSPHHLGAEMLKTMTGIDMKHVTYRGSVQAMQDVIGGHIQAMIMDLQPALELIREGKLRALAVTTANRVPALPDVPSIAESGLPGYEMVAWQGIVAPANLPLVIRDRLAGDINALIAMPTTQKRLIDMSLEPMKSTPESFASYVNSEIDRWGPIVKASGATAE